MHDLLLLQVAQSAPAFTAGDLGEAAQLAPVFVGVSQIVKFHPRFNERHLVWLCPLFALIVGVLFVTVGSDAHATFTDHFRTAAKWFMAGILAPAIYKLQAKDGLLGMIPGIGPALGGKLLPPTSAVVSPPLAAPSPLPVVVQAPSSPIINTLPGQTMTSGGIPPPPALPPPPSPKS